MDYQPTADLDKQIAQISKILRSNPHEAYIRSSEILSRLGSVDEAQRCTLYRLRGTALQLLTRYPEAIADINRSIQIAEALSDEDRAAEAYTCLGVCYRHTGEVQKSMDAQQRAIDLATHAGNKIAEANARVSLGVLLASMGMRDRTIEQYLVARRLFTETENRRGIANVLNNLAGLYFRSEEYDRAIEYLEEVMTHYRAIEDQGLVQLGLTNIGALYIRLKRFDEARTALAESLALATRTGTPASLIEIYYNHGELAFAEERERDAITYYEKALKEAMNLDNKRTLALALKQLGACYLRTEEFAESERCLVAGLEAFRKLGYMREEEAEVLVLIAECAKRLHKHEEAYDRLKESQQIILDTTAKEVSQQLKNLQIQFNLESVEKEKALISEKNFELERVNMRLDVLNKQKDRMLKVVSHDIRNPLSAIIGMANVLRTEADQPQQDIHEMASIIEESSRRLLEMVDRFLDHSYIESHGKELERTRFLIHDSVESAYQTIAPTVQQKRLLFESEILAGEFSLDRPKFEQILVNLLSNSAKFTEMGGRILVTATEAKESGGLVIQISDTGVGIEPEMLPRIFDSMPDSLKAGTVGEKGSGIGLPLVKELVELHSGTINAISELGVGTTITLFFPKA